MLVPLLTKFGREEQGEILRNVDKLVDEERLRLLTHKRHLLIFRFCHAASVFS